MIQSPKLTQLKVKIRFCLLLQVSYYSCSWWKGRFPSQGWMYLTVNYMAFYSYVLGRELKVLLRYYHGRGEGGGPKTPQNNLRVRTTKTARNLTKNLKRNLKNPTLKLMGRANYFSPSCPLDTHVTRYIG